MKLRMRTGRSVAAVVGVCLLAGLAAACGSALDPNQVAQGGTGTSQGDGTTAGGALPGTGGGGTTTDTTGGGGTTTDTTGGGGTTTDTTGGGGTTTDTTGGGTTTGTTGGGGTTTDTTGGGTTAGTTGGGGATTGGGTTGGGPATGTTGGTGPGASNPSSGSSTAPGGSSGGTAPPSTSTDACAGFQNGTGITDDTITIGNSSDVSGPVPGLFAASQDALKAYVSYFNSTSSICGRKLKLITYDSKTDAGADQQAYVAACTQTFAMVGSTSAFDSGGAAAAQSCGLPDLRSAALTHDRDACTTCYGAQSANASEYTNAVPDYIKKYYPDAAPHAAFLFLNAGASAENTKTQAELEQRRGIHYDYVQGIDTTEFNYAPYAQEIKDKKIGSVQFTGSYQASIRLQQALQQAGYKPQIFIQDPTVYVPEYATGGGSAVDGTTVFTNFLPFEDAASNPAMETYLGALNQSNPSAEPTFFGVFSWSAAVLFTQLATQLGGKLTRASLVQAMSKVDNWTAGGMTEPQHVGPKNSGDCFRFIVLQGSSWVPGKSGTKPICDGIGHI